MGQGLCFKDMGMMIPQWGEDYFMTHCLDHIGVGRISDFASVGDNVCTGGSCADQYFSAFHPFKTADLWQTCWDQAHGKGPPSTTVVIPIDGVFLVTLSVVSVLHAP